MGKISQPVKYLVKHTYHHVQGLQILVPGFPLQEGNFTRGEDSATGVYLPSPQFLYLPFPSVSLCPIKVYFKKMDKSSIQIKAVKNLLSVNPCYKGT